MGATQEFVRLHTSSQQAAAPLPQTPTHTHKHSVGVINGLHHVRENGGHIRHGLDLGGHRAAEHLFNPLSSQMHRLNPCCTRRACAYAYVCARACVCVRAQSIAIRKHVRPPQITALSALEPRGNYHVHCDKHNKKQRQQSVSIQLQIWTSGLIARTHSHAHTHPHTLLFPRTDM